MNWTLDDLGDLNTCEPCELGMLDELSLCL